MLSEIRAAQEVKVSEQELWPQLVKVIQQTIHEVEGGTQLHFDAAPASRPTPPQQRIPAYLAAMEMRMWDPSATATSL